MQRSGRDIEYVKHTFWSPILQLSSLCGLVLGLGDIDALKALTEAHTGLRELGDRCLEYHRYVTRDTTKDDASCDLMCLHPTDCGALDDLVSLPLAHRHLSSGSLSLARSTAARIIGRFCPT